MYSLLSLPPRSDVDTTVGHRPSGNIVRPLPLLPFSLPSSLLYFGRVNPSSVVSQNCRLTSFSFAPPTRGYNHVFHRRRGGYAL